MLSEIIDPQLNKQMKNLHTILKRDENHLMLEEQALVGHCSIDGKMSTVNKSQVAARPKSFNSINALVKHVRASILEVGNDAMEEELVETNPFDLDDD